MAEVKRYWHSDGNGTACLYHQLQYVLATDYDAAQARIRTLEAELEKSVNNARGLWIDVEQQAQRVRELEAERDKLRAAQAWQPIETAPKDGTVIDLWDADWKRRIVGASWACHYWMNGKPQREPSWGPDDRDGPFCSRPTHWMTHWMPLPPAPQSGEGEG